MISRLELERIARQTKLPLHLQEKDYLQNLILFNLSKIETAKNLLFKGGTCLELVYGLDRFSEDLGFVNGLKETEIDNLFKQIISSLEKFGVKSHFKYKKILKQGREIRLQCQGPLYKGKATSLSGLKIDLSLRSDVYLPTDIKTIFPKYLDIPRFPVKVMNIAEILSEKFRAFLMRGQSRDLYDIWFLINKDIKIDLDLIKIKLKNYPQFKFRKPEILKLSQKLQKVWIKELSLMVQNPPSFEEVIEKIKKSMLFE